MHLYAFLSAATATTTWSWNLDLHTLITLEGAKPLQCHRSMQIQDPGSGGCGCGLKCINIEKCTNKCDKLGFHQSTLNQRYVWASFLMCHRQPTSPGHPRLGRLGEFSERLTDVRRDGRPTDVRQTTSDGRLTDVKQTSDGRPLDVQDIKAFRKTSGTSSTIMTTFH